MIGPRSSRPGQPHAGSPTLAPRPPTHGPTDLVRVVSPRRWPVVPHLRWPALRGLHRVRLNTLRMRLVVWYVLVFALVLAIFSSSVYGAGTRNLRAEIDGLLAAEAQVVVDSLATQQGPPQLMRGASPLAEGTVVALYDPSGQRLLAGQGLPANDDPMLLGPPTQDRPPAQTVSLDGLDGSDGAENWRVLLVRAHEADGSEVLVQVARSERDVDRALHNLAVALAVILPATLLLASLGGSFVAGRVLDPIDRITRAAERIGNSQDLSQRLGLPRRDHEIGRLAATFDSMLARLERAFARNQQFTADASHELRTPLALLISQADLALSQPRSAEEYQAALRSVREDAERLARLVDDLLTLARADIGSELLRPEPLDLQLLAEGVAATMQPLADARGVRLECQLGAPLVVTGDQTRLTQLVVNLVDNALKYTPAGGSVRLWTERGAGWARLEVADTGIGIAAEHLPHIFERFYRVDKARTGSQTSSTGLGLALGRWIARAHGGEIEVQSRPGQGSRFSVHLPA